MLLEAEPGLVPALQKVFSVYAAFWVTVLVVLFVAVGLLSRKREQILSKSQSHEGHSHH
ncbi:MAG TPA: hypothetical protein VMJ70_10945 [Candidatus Sulfotelmatobacter sp.]|nr:hypothetical protein [Candidatus Sulfotelmatobacter sp.]